MKGCKTAVRACVAIIVGCAFWSAPISEASARGGPFLEGLGGLGLHTWVETGNDSALDPGPALGGVIGVRAATWLSAEFMWLAYWKGDVSSQSAEGEQAMEWSTRAYLMGVRYEPWRVMSRLRLGVTGGVGLTFLDIGLESSDLPAQEAEAFTWYSGVRATWTITESFYAGADLRYLFTLTWKNAVGSQATLDNFETLPLLMTAHVGYRLDLY